MEAQLKGAVLIALVVVPQWRCPILKPLSAKLPPKSETAPHLGWQDGTILQPGCQDSSMGDKSVTRFCADNLDCEF